MPLGLLRDRWYKNHHFGHQSPNGLPAPKVRKIFVWYLWYVRVFHMIFSLKVKKPRKNNSEKKESDKCLPLKFLCFFCFSDSTMVNHIFNHHLWNIFFSNDQTVANQRIWTLFVRIRNLTRRKKSDWFEILGSRLRKEIILLMEGTLYQLMWRICHFFIGFYIDI